MPNRFPDGGPLRQLPGETLEQMMARVHALSHTITLDESQRQMTLMALAHLAVERPGWLSVLSETAKTMDNLREDQPVMFMHFYELRKANLSLEQSRWAKAEEGVATEIKNNG